jgi:hypothetical protein
MSCTLALLLGLVPWLLAVLKILCNLSSDDWKPTCRLNMHSGCGKVREGCPSLMGQNIWAYLICSCLFYDTLQSHLLLRLFSRTLQLLGYTWCGRPRCEICASGCVVCLICRTRANVLFCYDKRFLHLWICLLFPLVLTLFWALFFLTLQLDLNGEGQMQRHLLLARRRRLPLSFIIILHCCIYERSVSLFFCIQDLTSSIDASRLYVDRKFLVNWFSSLPQLPMESSGSVLNQDRAAPVRYSCKLCIAVALYPTSICNA